jgi:hypothetical protein
MENLLPIISFFCGCGQSLYTLSTNVLAYNADLQCPACGAEYQCRDSLIAVAVPAIQVESLPTHIQPHSESGIEA